MNTADNELSFNDLPKAVTRILSDVEDIKQMLNEMHHRQETTKPADRHVPMTVDEAAEYLTLPKNTLYDKLAKGEIPSTKPGKRYVLYKDELDKWLECNRKTAVPMTAEERNNAILASNRRKPKSKSWRNDGQ